MPVFSVTVTATVEAADEADARLIALGDEPVSPGRWVVGEAGEVAELTADQAAAIMEFAVSLSMALSWPRESYTEDPDHPGVLFSPAAAATMRRLRGQHD